MLTHVNSGAASSLNNGTHCNTLHNHSNYPNSSSMLKNSYPTASSLKSFAHHSSPAIDYRQQPSPPGVTPDKPTNKDEDFPMPGPTTSRKRIHHDENKTKCSVGMRSTNGDDNNDAGKNIPTKESPLAKRRPVDLSISTQRMSELLDSPTFVPNSISNNFK